MPYDHEIIDARIGLPPVVQKCNSSVCQNKKRRFDFVRRDPITGRKYYACIYCGKTIVK